MTNRAWIRFLGHANILERDPTTICRQTPPTVQNKKEVRIYDYVDIQIKMLENMYQRRLNGYASMGYKAKGEEVMDAPLDIIFNKDNFISVFNQDIIAAKKEILIVSPFARQRRTHQMIQHLNTAIGEHILITVVTRPKEDFPK